MLAVANKRHDIGDDLTDPRESQLPDVGIVQLDDPETKTDPRAGNPGVKEQA